jgi:hypothetical protein
MTLPDPTLVGGGGGDNTTGVGGTAGAGNYPGLPGSQFTAAGPGAGGNQGSGYAGAFIAAGGAGGGGYFGGGSGGAHLTGSSSDAGGGGGGSDYGDPSVSGFSVTPKAGTATGAGPGAGEANVVLTYTTASGLAATLVSHSNGVAPGTALADKATAIQTAVNADPSQTATACADITNYLGLVKAQTNKKLSASNATMLTNDAMALSAALGCT